VVFSSHLFIFYFLPLSLLVYYSLFRAPQRWRNFVLVIFGYAFYGWTEPRFIPLMFGTTLLDWLISLVIAHNTWNIWRARHEPVVALERGAARNKTQKQAIALSVILNLAVLGFFKYFNFGVLATTPWRNRSAWKVGNGTRSFA
jgi:alginate O-acetyltransferase complex protein AlgI